MTSLLRSASLTAACLITPCLTAPAAQAQVLHNGGGSIQGPLCVGFDCTSSETFGFDALRLKQNDIRIRFDDVSSTGDFPNNDWQLTINETINGGMDKFAVEDLTGGTTPFTIEAAAPDASLYVDGSGEVGIGTGTPVVELHILDGDTPSIRLDQNGSGGFPAFTWDMGANDANFFVRDATNNQLPLRILAGADSNALVVAANNNVGLGTETPGAQFEMSSTASFNFFRISATGAAINESVDITFTGGPLGTGQLRYNIVDGDNQEMSLDANGNMVLDGTLTTAGPTCAGGCDRVFDADYPLPSIEDHAAQMFAAGHLPSLGPTLPGQPVNMTEQMGQMLNALEHAHIYIARQQELITDLQARLSLLEAR